MIAPMPQNDFERFFHELTGSPSPFPWQEKLFHRFMTNSVERALDIPTGLGKTTVMAVWLLARAEGASIPRRLVYIVDRRAVVDQATEVANALREAVVRHPNLGAALKLNGRPLPISTLRGQHVDNKQWLEDPSSPAIIVGTIDMIGSRLLFEGYGVSRKMRPYHAGLLGADTLVVLDEAHLVPPFEMLLDAIASNSAGVAPRDAEARAIVPQFKLMSLSATGRKRSERPFSLTNDDLKHPIVRQRLDAKKRLRLKPLKVEDDLAKKLAKMAWIIAGRGKRAVRVIVFCDKRKVAEAAKKALELLAKAVDQKDIKERTELFVGGRRVYERELAAARLRELGFIAGSNVALAKPTFVFATSAGEVGVDLDADHMVSDLVEWERMIQRLGRVNRRGEGDAQVVVLVEPDPKPDKAAKAALAKDPEKREEKETKALEAHQQKVERARAKRKPFDHLPRYDDDTINASPGAIRDLKTRADSDEKLRAMLDAATTSEPLRPALTRPIVDAWSMTSLKEHTGRAEIGPWLRGWDEKDPPQTTVLWRTHLPIRNHGRVSPKEIEAFFEAAPPHTSEELVTESDSVLNWLTKRAKTLSEETEHNTVVGLNLDQPFGLVFSPASDLRARLFLTSEGLRFSHEARGKDREEDADKRSLRNATLVVDARFAGLHDTGLLNSAEMNPPRTADDGQDWLPPIDGEPVVRFRIRSIDADTSQHRPMEPQWRTRLRFPTTINDEREASGWLVIEKWRSDSATEEDRAVGHCQVLEDHQKLAAVRARELAERLNLPEKHTEMLTIAARLHDEGKRANRWQRAFNAPTDGKDYAKTPGPINVALLAGYRHEFRSIDVAAKDSELLKLPRELQELALHLIAAHHGYGRPVIGVSGCEDAPPSKLEARARDVTLRFARLQPRWGPWGLAWWESLLRAVDHQASRENDAAGTEAAREGAR
jgi:CRISPR-associated endonuclease/helicase Cas3